jgi:hypothetical protein
LEPQLVFLTRDNLHPVALLVEQAERRAEHSREKPVRWACKGLALVAVDKVVGRVGRC